MKTLLLLCKSTHDAIVIDRFCRKEQIACTVIPVPREFSSKCGIALQIKPSDLERVQKFCDEKKIAPIWHEQTS